MWVEVTVAEIIDWMKEHEVVWDDFCRYSGIDPDMKNYKLTGKGSIFCPKGSVQYRPCIMMMEEDTSKRKRKRKGE